ncbi:hypothetical protein LEN26_018044 [Aphanomyces euteiches]|nr:hypothetical protein LEN26_018044 [Aphanomyces euteiches]KAH9121696.1 hypothetical protein AeMF1_006693 [Aphanomyces euteiches]KAH9183843.1 hypothetical protein AeNC1_014181 [Aphanomyces euteiches]
MSSKKSRKPTREVAALELKTNGRQLDCRLVYSRPLLLVDCSLCVMQENGAARPIVVTGPSKIERDGAGVFACVGLLPGDFVTTYGREVVFQVPQEPSYAIRYDFGATPAWIDGLREF